MKKFGLIIVIVVLSLMGSQSLKAQSVNSSNLRCLTRISGLTDDQQEKITALEQSYQSQMTEFRSERRNTSNITEKQSLFEKMQAAKTTHRADVLSVLNGLQKDEYLALAAGAGKQNKNGQRDEKPGMKKSSENGKQGKGNGQGRGKGKGGKKGNCQNAGCGGGKGKA